MRRRTIKKVIIFIVIILIAVIGIKVIINTQKKQIKRLKLLYEDLNASQIYSFEIEGNNEEKITIAKNGDKTVIDDYSENNHTTTIVKDENTYLVLHNREEYYIYEQNNVEQTILTDGLKEIISKEFVIGNEKIKGKNYIYEEYEGSTIFMMSNSTGAEEQDIRTRFYFDNQNNLTYIRTIKGVNQELLKINLKKEVNDSIFEIPSNYAEN